MKEFTTQYFIMKEHDVIEYVKTMLNFFNRDADLTCKEIGDGNLNYVFRVIDQRSNKSLIIKQAGEYARISDEFKLSPNRNRIESEILEYQNKLAPGFVPRVYKYDSIMNCFVTEDLSNYQIMKKALLNHKMFPLFADQITTFLVKTLLLTSDVVEPHKNKKMMVQRYVNPELCAITEDLVYTEPFYDCPRNDVSEVLVDFVREHIWEDSRLVLETAKLKFEFMTKAQSLIHGDLHTGSIFINADSIKIIDPEFSFYGPAGYDVGNIIAHLIFTYLNGLYTIQDNFKRKEFLNYLWTTIEEIIDLFKIKFSNSWDLRATEQVTKYVGFKEYYIDSIIRDASAVCGLELCRRIIGIAHVQDITSITNTTSRTAAEKAAIILGKTFILDRGTIKDGSDFIRILKNTQNSLLEK